MNYTEKEIHLIKMNAFNRGRIEGALVTLAVAAVAVILMLV